jgi:hypothetical protein
MPNIDPLHSSALIVGAPGNSAGGRNAGAVFVYLNNSKREFPLLFSQSGEQKDAKLGFAVASADTRGSGTPDLISSAPLYTKNKTKTGRVYVWAVKVDGTL